LLDSNLELQTKVIILNIELKLEILKSVESLFIWFFFFVLAQECLIINITKEITWENGNICLTQREVKRELGKKCYEIKIEIIRHKHALKWG